MKKWYKEEWEFKIKVISVGKDNRPNNCRMGFELGDTFECKYDCPKDFCAKSMMKVFPIFEAVRSGGDLKNLGGISRCEMEIICPDGVVKFKISAEQSG